MNALVGAWSYASAAIAFTLLTLLLVSRWRGGRSQRAWLTLACFMTAAWAAFEAWMLSRGMVSWFGRTLEVARDAAWFTFLFSLLGLAGGRDRPIRAVAVFLYALCAAMLIMSLPLFPPELAQRRWPIGLLGGVALSVAGLALVEQLFRNARAEQRWAIKYLCFGVGGIFAYDFYLYADALLFNQIDFETWTARGFAYALAVPLITIAAARNPQWSLDLFVSRRIVFHSAAIIGAGIYLLVMAAAGYYIRYVGGSWGGVLQAAFLFGAVVLMFAMLFSGSFRAHVKVFFNKNFFTYRYDYRDEWLRFTRTLSQGEPGVALRERSIEAIANLVESPGGSLWLAQDNGDYAEVAHWNAGRCNATLPHDDPLARFMEVRYWVVNLIEWRERPELYENMPMPGWLETMPKAWLLVPLILHERLLGFVMLSAPRAHMHFDWEVSDLLKTSGRQAASFLAQLEAAEALAVARQFDSFNRMSAFVVHDLKNLVAQLSLLLSNAEKHRSNPAFFEDMLETVGFSIEKMKRLLGQLRAGATQGLPGQTIDLSELVRDAVAAKSQSEPQPTLSGELPHLNISAHRERLTRVLGHVLQNAIEATPGDGSVSVSLARRDEYAVIEVADTGCGMDAAFISTQLFRPFDSTKSTGMGIGAYECREYVREIGGKLEVASEPGKGTQFSIMIPLAQSIDAPALVEGAAVERG